MSAFACWTPEPLARDVRAAIERLCRSDGVRRVAVMPDVHLAGDVCIGVVTATERVLYPQAVGGDIGCGVATLRLEGTDVDAVTPAAAERLLVLLRERVPIVRRAAPCEVPVEDLDVLPLRARTRRDLDVEFGTVGRGNHFVELQVDEEGALWLAVHSGSRALGPALRAVFVGEDPPRLVPLADDGDGHHYRMAHDVAVAFAQANRRALAEAAVSAFVEVLGARADWTTWCDVVHNFVRREEHFGEELWVHRKGACSAREGEPGVIPGSMGTATLHVTGRGEATSMCSSSHGAGRCLPRGAARRAIGVRRFQRDVDGVWFDRRLTARLLDEAPSAYKDIDKVMRAQRDLVRITRRLRPVLVHKGA
ncbi:MAG: RtcB family protein [Planctomycetota bacterium]